MWSVVEKTALAEAEIEYQDYTVDTIYREVSGERFDEASKGSSSACSKPWPHRQRDHPGQGDERFGKDQP